MTQAYEPYYQHLAEIRKTKQQAELIRDQLLCEYQRLEEEESHKPKMCEDPRRRQGREAMRKAIAAANRAISSINQALREIERVKDE